MEIYVTVEDLRPINEALGRGSDVEIQRTKDGYRIIEQKVKVLKKGPARKTPPDLGR